MDTSATEDAAEESSRSGVVRRVRVGRCGVAGRLATAAGARGVVACVSLGAGARRSRVEEHAAARGPDTSRRELQLQSVRVLRRHRLATLHVELLTASEAGNAELARDVARLAERIAEVLDWAAAREDIGHLRVGLCAADVAAAAALCAATLRPARVVAVVARSGRPDLAGPALARVSAPTLLVVGGADPQCVQLNRAAMPMLACEKRLEVVPGATRRFEEPGTREAVLHLAGAWFANHLAAAPMPN